MNNKELNDLNIIITDMRKTTVTLEYIIEKIINAITHPGELLTDGECMDEVWNFLDSKGYDLEAAKKKRQDYYDTNGKSEYKKEYL